MHAEHQSSRGAGWTPPTKTTGRGSPSQTRAEGHPSLFSAALPVFAQYVSTKKPPRNKTWSPWEAGRHWGPGDLNALFDCPPPGEAARARRPARRLRPDLRRSVSELATHPRSIFLSRRGHQTRARTDGRSWGRGLAGERPGRAGVSQPHAPWPAPPPGPLLFPPRPRSPRVPRALPLPLPGGGHGGGEGGGTIT